MKKIEWTVESGADKGATFVITRMSAFDADKWARRLVKALARSAGKLDQEVIEAGILGLTGLSMSVYAQLDDDVADAALARLLECVKVRPQGMPVSIEPRALIEEDLQDPETLQTIYAKAFELHVDFLKAAAFLVSPLAAALAGKFNPQNP